MIDWNQVFGMFIMLGAGAILLALAIVFLWVVARIIRSAVS